MGWLVFVTTAAVIPWFPDGATGARWAILSVALPTIFLYTRQLMATWGHALIIGFTLWCGITLLWCQNFPDAIYIYWHLMLFCIAVLIAAETDLDMELVYVSAGFALALNTLVVVAQVNGYNFVPSSIPPGGLFFNKNAGPELAAMVAVGLIGCRQFFLAAVAVIPIITPPISRAPLVALLAAGLAWLWNRSRWAALTAGAVFLVVFILLAAMPARIEAGASRIFVWADAVTNLSWLGHGVGSFIVNYPVFEFAHNDLLQITYETGAIGLILLVGFFVYCMSRHDDGVNRLALLTFLVEGLFGFPFYMPATCLVAGFAAGALCRDRALVRDLVPIR